MKKDAGGQGGPTGAGGSPDDQRTWPERDTVPPQGLGTSVHRARQAPGEPADRWACRGHTLDTQAFTGPHGGEHAMAHTCRDTQHRRAQGHSCPSRVPATNPRAHTSQSPFLSQPPFLTQGRPASHPQGPQRSANQHFPLIRSVPRPLLRARSCGNLRGASGSRPAPGAPI